MLTDGPFDGVRQLLEAFSDMSYHMSLMYAWCPTDKNSECQVWRVAILKARRVCTLPYPF